MRHSAWLLQAGAVPPKNRLSAWSYCQQAKICADAVVRILSGGAPDPAPVTNSACYSIITPGRARHGCGARSKRRLDGLEQQKLQADETWLNALMADAYA